MRRAYRIMREARRGLSEKAGELRQFLNFHSKWAEMMGQANPGASTARSGEQKSLSRREALRSGVVSSMFYAQSRPLKTQGVPPDCAGRDGFMRGGCLGCVTTKSNLFSASGLTVAVRGEVE